MLAKQAPGMGVIVASGTSGKNAVYQLSTQQLKRLTGDAALPPSVTTYDSHSFQFHY